VINIDAGERNGDVVSLRMVGAGDEVVMITEKGILIRTPVNEIRETGRNAAGVRLIRLDDADKLVAMAKIDADVRAEESSTADSAETDSPASDSSPSDSPPPSDKPDTTEPNA
jgi:DNA gyrase subunit A